MQEKDFTIQELKENSSFRRMARGIASAEEVQKWNRWIESCEGNRMKAKEATSDLIGFEFNSPDIPDLEKQWAKVYSKMVDKPKRVTPLSRRNNENTLRWLFRAVAVILIIGFAGFGSYYFYEQETSIPQLEQLSEVRTITTEEGEQKTLQFSNGSEVILNSYSSLTYRLGISNNSTIEVTLEGEAWFDAEPNRSSDQPAFAVATPDGIIRDIGTKFLVTVENGHSRVVLQEGLVEVESLSQIESNSQDEKVRFLIQKGEMVEFNRSDIIERRTVNPTFYTSWASGFMELEDSSVQEFAEYVENRFRVEVEIRDSVLIDVRLNGTVYFRSLDELMRSVSEVIGISVYRSAERDTVYIGSVE